MNLLQLKDGILEIDPMAYTLKPFKKIWEDDRSPNKSEAVKTMSYVYHWADFKSDFADILDEETKHQAICKNVLGVLDFEITDVVQNAIDFYTERQSTVLMQMYKAALVGVDKIRKHLLAINLEERDKNNKPVHNAKQINSLIKELTDTAESINKLEKRVKAEMQDNESNARGKKEKSDFEDGL